MTIPVWVEQSNGTFTASVLDRSELKASGASRDDAMLALRNALRPQLASGELESLDLDLVGVSGLAGRCQDDPSILEIAEEAYRLREQEKAAEMAEYDRD